VAALWPSAIPSIGDRLRPPSLTYRSSGIAQHASLGAPLHRLPSGHQDAE
jgi:hypothetical protein